MNEALVLILSLSVSGTALAIAFLIIKPFVRHRISKALQYYLWLVVLARLVLPVGLPANVRTATGGNTSDTLVAIVQKAAASSTLRPAQSGLPVSANGKTGVTAAVPAVPTVTHYPSILLNHLLLIWMFGVIISLLLQSAGYMRLSLLLIKSNRLAQSDIGQVMRKQIKITIPVYTNCYVNTPLLLGLFKPCIILPEMDFSEEQLRNVFLHEMTHYYHKDILLKWIVVFVTSIHWFNPMMYFLKREINRASELACDEAVIKAMNGAEKQSYGETLLSVAAERRNAFGALFTTMNEDKRAMKARLVAIMKHKNSKRISAAYISILLVAVCTLASCAVVRLPSAQKAQPSVGSISGTSANEIKFTSMTYQGLDVDRPGQYAVHAISDQAVMNQVWKTMNMHDWVLTKAFKSNAESVIKLHYTGERSGWYMITPDNFGYYSSGKGKKLKTRSPFGGFAEDSDRSYALPSGVYNSVAKLLKNYTEKHPPKAELHDLVENTLNAKDVVVLYQKIEVRSSDFTSSQFVASFIKAFGDLSNWKQVSASSIKDFTDNCTIDFRTNDVTITIFSNQNLVNINNQGVEFWYNVPSKVRTDILQVVKYLSMQKAPIK